MKKPTYKELWERLEIVLAENEKLTAKVADLERKLADRERQDNRQAARFRKDEDQRKSPSEHKKPGRKPGHPGSRKLPPSPDQVQREERVALECCPDCKAELTERAEHVHYVLDLPVLPVEWSKYITESGFCVNCNCRRWSSHEEMPSLAVGAAGVTFGHRFLSVATLLKTSCGMSFAKMANIFKHLYGIDVSPSGLMKALSRVESALLPTQEAIQQEIKSSKKVHLDETGWYVAGASYWAWVACTETLTLYKIVKGRGRDVAVSLIGKDYQGCAHSDFLNTYAKLNGRQSKCCFHLLTKIKQLRQVCRNDDKPTRKRFLIQLKRIIQDAIALWHDQAQCSEELFSTLRGNIESRLDDLLSRRPNDPENRKLWRRVMRYRLQIFRFLYDPDAEPTNSRAERQLRPLVVERKLSGGNRSERGAERIAVLHSVCATLKQRGANIVESVLEALLGRRDNLLCPG